MDTLQVNNLYENGKNNLNKNRKNIVSGVSEYPRPYETLKVDSSQSQLYDALQHNVNYFTLERQQKKTTIKKKYVLFCFLGLLLGGIIAGVTFAVLQFTNLLQNDSPVCESLETRCRIDNGYIFYQDLCLCIKYINTPLSHDNATENCRQDGAELVRVTSASVQERVEVYLDTFVNGEVYIQGTLNNNGVWRFDDGTEMTFFNWNTAGGQPRGRLNENQIIIRKSQQFRWHDVFPSNRFRSLCQIV